MADEAASKKSPIDEARARELLGDARERIEGELADVKRRLKGEIDGARDETNPEDSGERIEEESVDEALARSLELQLEAIGRAEKRLEEGTYGFSVESGAPIPAKRLEKLPWAERTIEEESRRPG